MKNWQIIFLFAAIAAISLSLAACGSNSNDVPSLAVPANPIVEDEDLDDEARMMEFAQCLRNEGMQITDPIVDSDGNIQMPELVEGATASKKEWVAAYDVCGEIIRNITFEKKKLNRSEQVDEFVEMAACMRDEGFDVEDPTVETLDIWLTDFKNLFDWDDPDAEAIFEACMGGSSKGDDGKGK